jgi:hypothetical protein
VDRRHTGVHGRPERRGRRGHDGARPPCGSPGARARGRGGRGRAGLGGVSSRWDRRWRGGTTGLEIAMAAASQSLWRKRLGGEENEGGSVGNDEERWGPFHSGRGRAHQGEEGGKGQRWRWD